MSSDSRKDHGRNAWRRDDNELAPASPHAAAQSRRTRGLFVTISLLLGLIGAAAAWLLFLRPMERPAFFTIAVREYADPRWPVNPFAVQDGARLFERFTAEKLSAYASQSKDQFDKQLVSLQSVSRSTLVIHLCALARVAEDDIAILPGDANPDEPHRWISLTDLLAKIKACPARNKLLLLDIMRPLADASLGVLSDDVSKAVEEALGARESTLPCWVMTAASSGESSQVSEVLQGSAFAYYVSEGLRGQADGFGASKSHNGRVTVQELADYVRFHVDRWARMNVGVKQTPRLFGKFDDFPLAGSLSKEVAEEKELVDLKYPAWLLEGWKLRDQAASDGFSHVRPQQFRRTQADLLRAETEWRAGIEDDRLKARMEPILESLKSKMKSVLASTRKKRDSIARAEGSPEEAKNAAAKEELVTTLLSLLPKFLEPEAKLDEEGKKKAAEVQKAAKDLSDKLKKMESHDAAWLVWESLVRAPNMTPGRLLGLSGILAGTDRPADGQWFESLTIERLLGFMRRVQENEWEWPTQSVHYLVKVNHEAQRTLAAIEREPAALGWIDDEWNEAEMLRRELETTILLGRPRMWPDAQAKLPGAAQAYKDIALRVAKLETSIRTWRDASERLPDLAATAIARGGWLSGEEVSWTGAVNAWRLLGAELASPKQGSLPADGFESARTIRRHLADLPPIRPFPKIGLMLDPIPRVVFETQAYLANPGLSASDRYGAWDAWRKASAELQKNTSDLDAGPGGSTTLPDLGDDPTPRREAFRKSLRVIANLSALDAAGMPIADSVRAELNAVRMGKTAGDKDERRIARSLATILGHDAPEALRSKKLSALRKDQLARVLAADDILVFRDLRLNPSQQVDEERTRSLDTFMRTRYVSEAAEWDRQQNGLSSRLKELASTIGR